jgi:hypothetical protein
MSNSRSAGEFAHSPQVRGRMSDGWYRVLVVSDAAWRVKKQRCSHCVPATPGLWLRPFTSYDDERPEQTLYSNNAYSPHSVCQVVRYSKIMLISFESFRIVWSLGNEVRRATKPARTIHRKTHDKTLHRKGTDSNTTMSTYKIASAKGSDCP